MPSPFPGMNPYLEQDDAWHDFHKTFQPHLAEVIVKHLADEYIVKLGENVYTHEIPADGRTVPSSHFPVDIERLSSVEIQNRHDRRLVTVIELLSPTHKENGRNREKYLLKRGRVLRSSAHLVEIDLSRGGQRCHSRTCCRSAPIASW